jgi:hypothetical protein
MRGKFRLRTEPADRYRGFQRLRNAVADSARDAALVPEAHLRLGGVDVHVDVVVAHAHSDGGDGVAPNRKLRLVGIDNREDQRAALHPTAVHKHRDGGAVAPMEEGGPARPVTHTPSSSNETSSIWAALSAP